MDKELFPGYLKQYLVADKIELISYSQRGQGVILPNGVMFIDAFESLEKQVKIAIHEVLHFHPAFIAYTGALWTGTCARDEHIENLIEEHAQKVLITRRDIVDLARESFIQARRKL